MNISPPEKTHILDVEGICLSYDHKPLLENVSLHLCEGEIVSLLGVSGSGKTTLFNVISGLLPPESGDVKLNGRSILGQVGEVSYMLQKDLLLKHLTVLENISLPLRLQGYSREEAKLEAAKHLERFGLKDFDKHYPAQISGGMAQRAAFLRTYLCGKKLTLLDEPFSALDALTKNQLHLWYIELLQELSITTLLITHDIDEAIKLSDRIYLLSPAVAGISQEIVIAPELRRSPQFELRAEFLEYKKEIIAALN